jgi:tRNA(Ile)-lysidine synthase
VLPLLDARWPEAEAALARSASLLADDARLLAAESARRLQAARTPEPRTLAVAPLMELEAPWRARVLRHWLATPAPAAFRVEWNGRAPLQLPGGELALDGGAGLPEEVLPLQVGSRQGGERIRLPGRGHSHALKDCLLRAGVPPWRRRHLPLLHAPDQELLAAGDAVLSGRWQRLCETHGLRLQWRPAAARD